MWPGPRLKSGDFQGDFGTCLGAGVRWLESGKDTGALWRPGFANSAAETELADGVILFAIEPVQVRAEHRQKEPEGDREKWPENNADAALEKFQHVDEFGP